MKKLFLATVLAGTVAMMGSVAFAVNTYEGATDDYELPQGFTFYNEVSSDVVEVCGSVYNRKRNLFAGTKDYNRPDGTGWYCSEFSGINEKVGISYNSEKLWFELAPQFSLKDNNQHWWCPMGGETSTNYDINNDDLSFAWTGLDWGIRFTPFDIVDFVLHHDTWTPGSYMPIIDKHVGGNLTGEGFGVVFKPVEGLRIGLEVPFTVAIVSAPNFLNAEYEDKRQGTGLDTQWLGTSDYRFVINAGVDYKLLDMITVGAFVENILNRDLRGYGLYANAELSFVNVNLGYTYNGEGTKLQFDDLVSGTPYEWLGLNEIWEQTIGGHHKINLSATASFGDFTAMFETLFNLFKQQSIYDLYAGAKVGYDLLPGKFNLALSAGIAYDLGNYKSTGSTRYRERGVDDFVVINSKKGSGDKNEVSAPILMLMPGITYNTGHNTFKIQANLKYFLDGDGSYEAKFPVSWRYTF